MVVAVGQKYLEFVLLASLLAVDFVYLFVYFVRLCGALIALKSV
jgi:hypothetical protein